MRWRRAVALAICTYTRDAELRVLRESDIDHGIVDITRAFNRRKPGEVKGTKSDCPRRFAVEANLLPLLEAMRSADGTELVVKLPSERAMARNLRRRLVKAGVTRAALHDGSDTSQNITWHDLRATGATWMAVRGDDARVASAMSRGLRTALAGTCSAQWRSEATARRSRSSRIRP